MQLPPILCWVQFGSNRFLAGDVQLLPYVGLPIHGALLAWSLWLLLRKK